MQSINRTDEATAGNGTASDAEQQRQLCADIEANLRSPMFSLLQWLQLLLLTCTFLSIIACIVHYHRLRILVHGNLLFLFANIFLVYFVHSLGHFVSIVRYRLLFFFYSDPCQLLTPVWMVALFYGPTYFYYIAYPAFHFCVMLERARATLMAEKYEGEGCRLGIWMALANWSISLGFMAFVVASAMADTELFGHPQGIIFLTSKYNNLPIFYISIFTLCLTIFTAICDWAITLVNRRIRANNSRTMEHYSLSRNYQLNENALAMRLILPIDIFYALIYAIYTLMLILLRAYRSQLGVVNFAIWYNVANTLLFLYSVITMLVYIRFLKFVSQCRHRNVNRQSTRDSEAKIYFKQLRAQWN